MNALAYRLWFPASLVLLGTGEAQAAEHAAPSHDANGAEDAAEHSTGGMPQLDPEWFASQIFWIAITFIGLYLAFSRKVLPEISSIIETRRERVQDDLDQADKLREEAEKVHAVYEEILSEARDNASELFARLEEDIRVKTTKKYNEFRERSTEEVKKVEASIQKAKKVAMKDMDGIAAEIAAEAAEKIIGIATDINKAKSVVENLNKKAA